MGSQRVRHDWATFTWWGDWDQICPLNINNDKTGQNTWDKYFQILYNTQDRTVIPRRRLWVWQSLCISVSKTFQDRLQGGSPHRIQSSCWVEETDIRVWGGWDGQNSEGRLSGGESLAEKRCSRYLHIFPGSPGKFYWFLNCWSVRIKSENLG